MYIIYTYMLLYPVYTECEQWDTFTFMNYFPADIEAAAYA